MGNEAMTGNRSEFLGIAFRAAALAGELIQKNLGRLSRDDVSVKEASDFVTRVDRESEQVIVATIREKYPDHDILAEESFRDKNTGGYRWIIDPLDGTTNFIHGYPVFAVSIALQHGDEIILGLVYDPLRGEVFTAEKQKGSFLNGKPARISGVSTLQESLIATGFPFRRKKLIEAYLELFRRIFNQVSDIRRAGSAALDLAHVACGRCDGFFEIGLSPWDAAAGSLLIKEAGGVITDFSGGNDYLGTGNVVAGIPLVHSAIIHDVKDIFKDILPA